jgi:hypothetical protein
MGEGHWITPERREYLRNALAILSLQFGAGDGDLAEFLEIWRASIPGNHSRTSFSGWSKECLILLNS